MNKHLRLTASLGVVRLAAALGVVLVLMVVAARGSGYAIGGPLSSCVKQSTNTTKVNGESHFISSFVSAPSTGAAIVTNAVFSNIYLWPNPGSQTWDQHLASLPRSGSSNETSEVLDDITCALVHSSYFDPVTQYGIAPPVYEGDEMTAQSCVDKAMQDAASHGGVIQTGALKDFVNCEQSTGGGTATQVNIFVSPDLKVDDYTCLLSCFGDSRDLCTTGASAYHDWYLGARNFTVIPTDTRCNRDASQLTVSLSHEMVETITDPAGFGWVHEYGERISFTTYTKGEVGDICSGIGQYPSPPVPFDDPTAGVGPLLVAPYWSNRDNTCEPKFIMNQTLAAQTGTPIIRFTAQTHTLSVPVTIPQGTAGQALQALEIAITTGGDNLNGGSGSGDNANIVLSLRSGQSYTVSNINGSNEWGNGTLHTAFLSFPPGIAVGEITGLTLTTFFGGGDNWNVNGITLKAAASVDSISWGYVWANQPSSASYTPSPFYQFNSSYGTANTITRTGTGAYTVSFPNLGFAAGTVHVTAYGSGTETCKVASWGPSGTTQQVNVRCFNISGLPVDTYYTVTYIGPLSASLPMSTAQPMAYVWADQPGSASYTPSLPYQFNSTGATNTITRTGTGTYVVWLPGLGVFSGHVQVTAYGYGSERCKVASWGPSGTTQQVNVRCFNISGLPVDTRYTLTYVKSTSIVGSFGHGAYTVSAYAWANQPSSASYTPSSPYQFNSIAGTINTITRLGTGSYAVNFPNQDLSEGDVQITAYGSGSEFCKVTYWTPSAGVRVGCFDSTGTPRDTYYNATFLNSYQLG